MSNYRNRNEVGLGLFLLILVAIVGVVLWIGYSVMMLCGILWGEFHWLAPIGFGPALGIGFFGGAVLGSAGLSVRGRTSE